MNRGTVEPTPPRFDIDVTGARGLQVGSHNTQHNYYAAVPPVRSTYGHQIRSIVPSRLLDREAELADLAAFCLAGHGPAYAWWRAPAWAGKSALMAWFALHPPDGVRVVPFFVTSRWGGYGDWRGFLDVVSEQLAEVLAEPGPANPRIFDFWALLDRAAQASADQGRRLVLLVDGLDEDRGVTGDRDAHSIAALLPARPVAGLRVIVSGRLNPPIPFDVGDDHPLRDPAIARELAPSAVAQVIRQDMEREMRGLWGGSRAERDVVGLIAAARGGLSAADLAELMAGGTAEEMSTADVDRLLVTAAGRSFVARPSRWQPGSRPDVYLLGHEELQISAAAQVGVTGFDRYWARIRQWAQGYRGRDWPPGTPEYLLRDYPLVVRTTGDLPHLVELAVDHRRHALMRRITGGHHGALSEIAAAQQDLMATEPPDVAAVARLAVHRQSLGRRSGELPWGLPAVWAGIGAVLGREGDISRAREIARSFTDPLRRCAELLDAAGVLTAKGSAEEAASFTADALTLAREITEPGLRAEALAKVAEADTGRGGTILDEALARAADIGDPDRRQPALAAIVEAAAATGRTGRATELAASIMSDRWRTQALQRAAQSAAGRGHLDAAETLLAAIDPPNQRAWALGAAIFAVAQADLAPGERAAAVRAWATRAETAARDIPEAQWRADMLGAVAYASALVGDSSRARAFIRRSEAAAADGRPDADRHASVSVACAHAVLGDTSDALAIALSAGSSHRAVAAALARGGRPDEAEALAAEIDEPTPGQRKREAARGPLADLARGADDSDVLPQLDALAALARVAVDVGDTDRAIRLCEQIEAATTTDAVAFLDETTTAELAGALAAAGYTDEALAYAETIGEPGQRNQARYLVARGAGHDEQTKVVAAIRSWTWTDAREVAAALAAVAETAAGAGDTARAVALAEESVAMTGPVDEPFEHATWFRVLADAARAMAVAGEPARACAIADRLAATESFHAIALTGAAVAAARAGQVAAARHIALALGHPDERARALARAALAALHAGRPEPARALALASAAEPIGEARPATTTRARSGTGFAVAAAVEVIDGPGGPTEARAMSDLMAITGAEIVRQALPADVDASSGPEFTAQSLVIPALSEDPRTDVSALLTEVFDAIGDHARARATATAAVVAARSIYSPRYKADALGNAARALAACGDIGEARSVADEAAAAAKHIGTWRKQEAAERAVMRVRGVIARAAARAGDLGVARALIDAITADDVRAEALTGLARDLAAEGDEDGAVALALSIGEPTGPARALAAVAATVTGPRAQVLAGQALQAGSWEVCLTALTTVAPGAVAAIAAEVRRVAPSPASDEAVEDSARMCAHLAPEPIPIGLLEKAGEPVDRLQRLGFAHVDQGGLRLYPSARATLREGASPAQATLALARAEQVLLAGDPGSTDDPATWSTWASLTPHILAVERAVTGPTGLHHLACRAAWYLLYSGDFRAGHELAADLHGRLSRQLGNDDDATLKAAAALGFALRRMVRYAEALPLDTDRLDRHRQIHGLDHPDTLRSANDLAIDKRRLGQVTAARELDEDTLARRKRVFGHDNAETLISASNLAFDLTLLGDLKGARKLNEDTLARRKHVLGRDHPDTLASANNLAFTLHRLGKLKQARKLNEDVLARRRRVLGDDHPDTLASAGGLAQVLHALGDLRAARDLDEETLVRQRRVLADDHPLLVDAEYKLTEVLQDLGDLPAARQLGEDVLARRRRAFGDDHSHTLEAATRLAIAVRRLGEPQTARMLDEDTLARSRRTRGDDDDTTLELVNGLANDLYELGEFDAARALNEDNLTRRTRLHGDDDPNTLISAHNLANCLHALGQLEAARDLYEQTLTRRRQVLGEDHPHTLGTAARLAENVRAREERET